MEEIWKDIPEFEGYYQISNLGRVRSMDRKIYNSWNDMFQNYTGKIMHPSRRKKGYLGICLTKNNKQKSFLIHRLVAEAFIPNPNNYPQINHKDEIKTNNCVENLEWCDCKYNVNYGSCKANSSRTRTNNMYNQKPVMCIETGVVFYNSRDVERKTGINSSNIRSACRGVYKTSHGYHWKYV